jgi:hypothetical protein
LKRKDKRLKELAQKAKQTDLVYFSNRRSSRKLLSPLRDSALNRNMARQAVNNSAIA